MPDHVFTWISKSGDTTVPRNIGARPPVSRRLSSTKLSGVAWFIAYSWTLMQHPFLSRSACRVMYSSTGITPACHLEAAARTVRVQFWSLAHTTQDASSKWDWGSWPQRKKGASLQLRRAFGRWAAAAFCVGCWPDVRDFLCGLIPRRGRVR